MNPSCWVFYRKTNKFYLKNYATNACVDIVRETTELLQLHPNHSHNEVSSIDIHSFHDKLHRELSTHLNVHSIQRLHIICVQLHSFCSFPGELPSSLSQGLPLLSLQLQRGAGQLAPRSLLLALHLSTFSYWVWRKLWLGERTAPLWRKHRSIIRHSENNQPRLLQDYKIKEVNHACLRSTWSIFMRWISRPDHVVPVKLMYKYCRDLLNNIIQLYY